MSNLPTYPASARSTFKAGSPDSPASPRSPRSPPVVATPTSARLPTLTGSHAEKQPHSMSRELVSLGMQAHDELARISRLRQTEVALLLEAEIKRNAAERRENQVKDFERRRRALLPRSLDGYERRESNRQRNEAQYANNQQAFERRIDSALQRLQDKERKHREARAAMDAEHEKQVEQMAEMLRKREAHVELMYESGIDEEESVRLASHWSKGLRGKIAERMRELAARQEAQRQCQRDEQARLNEEKQAEYKVRMELIKERTEKMVSDNALDLSVGERATTQRLEQLNADRAAKLEEQRQRETEQLAQVMGRARAHSEEHDARVLKQCEERTARMIHHKAEHDAAMRAKRDAAAEQRSARLQQHESQLQQKRESDEAARQALLRKVEQDNGREQVRKANLDTLIRSRRHATMRVAQLKDKLQDDQEHAQIWDGPISNGGKRQLEALKRSLKGVDEQCRQMPSLRTLNDDALMLCMRAA